MKTFELQAPRVIDDAGRVIGYGGSQDWFPDGWKRMSGCGATAGAGAAAVLGLFDGVVGSGKHGEDPDAGIALDRFPKDAYVDLMLEMFSRMTPKMMGYPYAGKWGRAFRTYAAEHGAHIEADVYDHWTDWKEAFAFVREHIDAGVPVPMLVLYHRAPEMQDEIWHWILVTGYTLPDEADEADAEDGAAGVQGPQIIVSDYADRDLYAAEIMLEAHPRNLVKMVDLQIQE